MAKKILVDATYPQETRVVLLNERNQIEELEYETANKHQIKGNIYLAKIVRIEPSLQAAFIDYGSEKNGFLPFSEIHPLYYHIPSSDRDKIEAELQSMARPNITSKDIKESKKSEKELSDSEMLSLDSESEDHDEDEENVSIEEENEIDTPNKKSFKESLYSQYKIQDVVKKGQVILVQAEKETRGNKGASFTSYLSLAGKYCVLMPNIGGHNGISRKIANSDERRRLREIIDEIIPQEEGNKASLIIRTAGVRKSAYEIKRDYDYLVRLWNKIRDVTLHSTAPTFIHMEDDIIKKTIRDMCDHHVKEVIVQGEYALACATEIMNNMLPSDTNKVVGYNSKTPLFSKFNVEEQLSNLYQPIASLSSGGYIVINPTEAMISIDVNSGRATSERSIEETAVRTNIEAAKEIARQLKLRDLSGLIVIDFIDMYESRNRKLVERTLKEALARDRAKIQVGHISTFGLLEMSRQRLRSSFLESNTKMCTHCNGKGIVRADESNAMLILRTIEQEIFKSEVNIVNTYAHITPIMHILNTKRHEIKAIEDKYGVKLNFYNDTNATSDSFSIEKIIGEANNESSIQQSKPALDSSARLFEDGMDQISANNKDNGASLTNKNRRSKKWKDKNTEIEKVESTSETSTEKEETNVIENKKHRKNKYNKKEYKKDIIAPKDATNNDEGLQVKEISKVDSDTEAHKKDLNKTKSKKRSKNKTNESNNEDQTNESDISENKQSSDKAKSTQQSIQTPKTSRSKTSKVKLDDASENKDNEKIVESETSSNIDKKESTKTRRRKK